MLRACCQVDIYHVQVSVAVVWRCLLPKNAALHQKSHVCSTVPVLISLLFRAVHISAIFISPPMPPQPHIPPLHAFCPILRGMPKKSSQLEHKNESHKLGRKNVHLLVAGYNRTPPPHIDKEVNGP